MLALRELTMTGIVIRILVAILLGGIIGMERGMKNRPAGLRTYMLVSIGACIVMMINQYAYQVYEIGDPLRLGAQVISGIGFLGAGTIIVTSHNQIKGLTTAAGLWASACVGLATGIGLYEVAVTGGIAVFVILTILHAWDSYTRSKAKIVNVYVELDKGQSMGDFFRQARECQLVVSDLQKEHEGGYDDETSFVVTIQGKRRMRQEELIRLLRGFEGIKYLEII